MPENLDSIREAYKRSMAIENFVARWRDYIATDLINNCTNTEYVSITAARLRDEAETLLEGPIAERGRQIIADYHVKEVQRRLDEIDTKN